MAVLTSALRDSEGRPGERRIPAALESVGAAIWVPWLAYWYSRVTPIEGGEVEEDPGRPGFVVSFDDLGIRDRLWGEAETGYQWKFEHPARGVRWHGRVAAASTVRQSIDVTPSHGGHAERIAPRDHSGVDAIAVLEVTAYRGEESGDSALVYLTWDIERDAYRVVGLKH